jgi:hypothetical protein
MQNILVLKHYKLKNSSGWSRSFNPDNEKYKQFINSYEEMKSMCISSAKKFLLGLDDIVIHNTEADDIQAAFKQHFYDLHDLWKSGNVNILYADLDVLFIREFNWFAVSDYFVMYALANSGLRYHGHNMDKKLWDLAFEKCESWDFDRWAYEQDIYQHMMRHPANWRYQARRTAEYSSLVVNRPTESPAEFFSQNQLCCAVHFHSSQGYRGLSQLNSMKEMFNFLKL